MEIILLLLGICALVAAGLAAFGSWGRLPVPPDVEIALSLNPVEKYGEKAVLCEDHLYKAESFFLYAREKRDLGEFEEAARVLALSHEELRVYGRRLLRLLAAMSLHSLAITESSSVPPPLLPASFRSSAISLLALGHRMAHKMVREPEARFRLRLSVIGRGISLAIEKISRLTRNIAGAPYELDQWGEIEESYADLHMLSDAALASLDSVIAAIEENERAFLRLERQIKRIQRGKSGG